MVTHLRPSGIDQRLEDFACRLSAETRGRWLGVISSDEEPETHLICSILRFASCAPFRVAHVCLKARDLQATSLAANTPRLRCLGGTIACGSKD